MYRMKSRWRVYGYYEQFDIHFRIKLLRQSLHLASDSYLVLDFDWQLGLTSLP